MPALAYSTPDVYLTKLGSELVLNQGSNPHRMQQANKRVLVIGGGVTGMTVCTYLSTNTISY